MTNSTRLREILASQGLTIAELVRRSGVSHSTANNAARGLVPGRGARERIATALGVPVDEVFPPNQPLAPSLAPEAAQAR